MINLEEFTNKHITGRTKSLFDDDIKENLLKISNTLNTSKILVIGGAGSIGSSYIESILKHSFTSLTIVDRNENELANLSRQINLSYGETISKKITFYAMDFSGEAFKRMFYKKKGFDLIANFAAHKHVRSEKDIFSCEEMFRNNVLNLKNLYELLKEIKPKNYFCVSTDKATNPVNLMGASKLIMENIVFSFSNDFKVSSSRFANVAFSNGSILDHTLTRIKNKQIITGPNDVKRYFVSKKESGEICLLASLLNQNKDVFIPKFKKNKMVYFEPILKNLILENGYDPVEVKSIDEGIKLLNSETIKYPIFLTKSDTSGEKLFEEFYKENDTIDEKSFKKLNVIKYKNSDWDIQKTYSLFNDLEIFFRTNKSENTNELTNLIKNYIDFNHKKSAKNLDQKL